MDQQMQIEDFKALSQPQVAKVVAEIAAEVDEDIRWREEMANERRELIERHNRVLRERLPTWGSVDLEPVHTRQQMIDQRMRERVLEGFMEGNFPVGGVIDYLGIPAMVEKNRFGEVVLAMKGENGGLERVNLPLEAALRFAARSTLQ